MAEVHLDHPGDVSWFKGYGPVPILGDCPHDCTHNAQSNIAWGPDYEHYVLNECTVREGCNKHCRGWSAEFPDERRDFTWGWKLIDSSQYTQTDS